MSSFWTLAPFSIMELTILSQPSASSALVWIFRRSWHVVQLVFRIFSFLTWASSWPAASAIMAVRAVAPIHRPVFTKLIFIAPESYQIGSLNLERLQRFGREKILRLQLPFGESLLIRVTQERAERLHIRLESVLPEFFSNNAFRIFDVLDQPRQHDFKGGSFT